MNCHLNRELLSGDAAEQNKTGLTVWWRLTGCSFVGAFHLVSDITERTQTEGIWKHSNDRNIWTEVGWYNKRLEKTA
jgi:hypothetical protein